jgi:hypothetical protein
MFGQHCIPRVNATGYTRGPVGLCFNLQCLTAQEAYNICRGDVVNALRSITTALDKRMKTAKEDAEKACDWSLWSDLSQVI